MSVRHLSNNPIDEAMWSTGLGHMPETARRRLLARFAPGRPIAEVRRGLARFGVKCADTVSGPISCRYSQFLLLGNRGMFGDDWREYRYFDFTVRLALRHGALRDIMVCYTETQETEKGPVFGKPDKPRKSKFKPCP